MATAFVQIAPGTIQEAMAVGLPGMPSPPAVFQPFHGGHPTPSPGSVAAGRRALEIAGSTFPGEMLVVLLSGGASALMVVPAVAVSLEDKIATTAFLLRSGADIHALNTVRKHLSRIKGGSLGAASRAPSLTLAVSDVIGDDLSVIGSGPTVSDPTTYRDALAVIDAAGGRACLPGSVLRWLERGVGGEVPETPKPGDPRLARAAARVIASRHDALAGARDAALALGYAVGIREGAVCGEAREAARDHVTAATALASGLPRPACILSAGETTVRVTGSGRGGRNQEFALAAAPALGALGGGVAVASLGTDGIDGPTDAAGAIVDSTTMERAAAAGLGAPETYLQDNNSYAFLSAVGDLVVTGPTGTNVGDLQILLVAGA